MLQRQNLLRSCLLLVIGCLLLSQSLTATYADGAPPPFPEGSSIAPNTNKTHVRMLSETVTLAIQPLDGTSTPTNSDVTQQDIQAWMKAKVEATFTLRNLGDQEESFDVWFPLGDKYGAPEKVPDISDFAAWVDGTPSTITNHPPRVPISKLDFDTMKDENYWYSFVPWASWPVRFPAGKDVTVHVTYTLFPRGSNRPTGDFTYILQTGSGWNGTIGEGTVSFKLPYPISFENIRPVTWENEAWLNDYRINNDALVWHFTDLKPDSHNNITVCVMEPARWMAVVDSRQAIQGNPKSPTAQLRYAIALSRIRSNYRDSHCSDESSSNYNNIVSAVGKLRDDLAPTDRIDLYAKYGMWFAGIHMPDELNQKDLDNREKLLTILHKDFSQWPDDPVYLLVKSLIESPDFASYTQPNKLLPDPTWFYS